MKSLELNQMEQYQAGSCLTSGAGLALTFAGAFLVASTGGAALFAAAFIVGSIDLADSCSR